MYTDLEDEFGDVVGKARRGQEIAVQELEQRAGLEAGTLGGIEAYETVPDGAAVERLAGALGLEAAKLKTSADKRFFPMQPAGRAVHGLQVEMLVLGSDFLMNGYIVSCAETKKGVVIDPGFDAEHIMKTIEDAALEIEYILLTHGHGDHIGALGDICDGTGAPAFISREDMSLLGDKSRWIEGAIVEGEIFTFGKEELQAKPTPGHTAGGTSLIHSEVAFVGDALFAGSLGGTRSLQAYRQQLEAVETQLLGLEEHVTLYPGHGPATTVAEERANNPFYA